MKYVFKLNKLYAWPQLLTDNVNNIPLEITDYIDCPGNEGFLIIISSLS